MTVNVRKMMLEIKRTGLQNGPFMFSPVGPMSRKKFLRLYLGKEKRKIVQKVPTNNLKLSS